MKYSIENSEEIRAIAEEVLTLLRRVEHLSSNYNSKLSQAMEYRLFSVAPNTQKKEISDAYFHFGMAMKDVISLADQPIYRLTTIMRQADEIYSAETIEYCDRILHPYMDLQESVGRFASRTETLISSSPVVPFRELSLELRRLLLRFDETCSLISEVIKASEES